MRLSRPWFHKRTACSSDFHLLGTLETLFLVKRQIHTLDDCSCRIEFVLLATSRIHIYFF